jgi:hypothetical protein
MTLDCAKLEWVDRSGSEDIPAPAIHYFLMLDMSV